MKLKKQVINTGKKIGTKIYNYFFSKRFKIFLWVLLWALVLSYILLLIFAKSIETAMIFPGKDINLKQLTNHPAGVIAAEEVTFTSKKWNTIAGIYIDNNAPKTVYYFHGNGAPMDHFYTEMRYIADLGYNLISYDFPGYGKSTGKPTQEEILDFSNTFYAHMKKELNFEDEDVIIWGYSVGTAVAIDFAKDKDFDKLVLFSPFASAHDMSAKAFGFPIQKLFFLPNTFVSRESIKSIEEPTLIVHGNTDIVVPFEQGKTVFENSPAEKKYFLEIDDLGHSLITERYGDVIQDYLVNFTKLGELEKKQTFLDRKLATKLLEKFQNEKYIAGLDLVSDESYTKYVDPNIPFSELWYIPEDMVSLQWEYVVDTKWNAQMRKEAAEKFQEMAQKFYTDRWEKMVMVSTYRSYNYQAGIKARWCPDNLCAKAGHSEHQSGLAVDFWSASTNAYWQSSEKLMERFAWLNEHAHEYGFHNTYQNGRDIDGYEIEPWHWRYVWIKFAKYLKENEITFAEHYYGIHKK